MKFSPACGASGIGSLPFTTPEEAMALIRRYLPEMPHWPQLPKRGKKEHFIYQFLNPLVEMGIVFTENEHILFDTQGNNWENSLTDFYSNYLLAQEGNSHSLEQFAIPPASAAGFYAFLKNIAQNPANTTWVKGQLAGPLSVGLNITDIQKRPAYYNPQMKDLLVKALALQARWQAVELGKLGFPVMIFVDDPALSAIGISTYITLTKEQLVKDLKEIVSEIQAGGAVAGAHSCAGIDWSILLEAGFEVISFDAYGYFSSLLGYIEPLNKFLAKGGSLAWGIVPTNHEILEIKLCDIKTMFMEQVKQLAQKGISESLLLRQTLITPSCGAGTLSDAEAQKIYSLVYELSEELRREFNIC